MNDIPVEYRVDVPAPWVIGDEVDPAEPSAGWVPTWVRSKAYRTELETFRAVPAHSLLSSAGRAFLFHLVRTTLPQTVLEIGTYFAGTAEVIARALHQNGTGLLITTDPFGGERCPLIFRQWPDALRRHVRFHAINSMALAQSLAQEQRLIDVAFIDGCHDYEYVLFDALAFGKLVRPGGVLVLDNAEQPGVYRACAEFLRHNPDWSELGDAMKMEVPDNPFAPTLGRSSVPDTTFLVLRAPDYWSVAPRGFLSTGQIRHEVTSFDAVRLQFQEDPPVGRLSIEACFRAFGQTLPLELRSLLTVDLDGTEGVGTLRLPIDPVLKVPADSVNSHDYVTLEIGLYWNPTDRRTPLRLRAMPAASNA